MSQTGVFICPSCQSVVRSEKLPGKALACESCGHEFGGAGGGVIDAAIAPAVSSGSAAVTEAQKISPVPRKTPAPKSGAIVRDVTRKKAPVAGQAVQAKLIEADLKSPAADGVSKTSENGDEEIIMPDGTRKVRRRKRKAKKERYRGMLIFLVGWLSVIAIVFFLFKGDSKGGSNSDDVEELDDTAQRDRFFLNKQLPEVQKAFKDFIKHPTNEGREQFIADAPSMARYFASHYRSRDFPRPEGGIRAVDAKVITLSEDPLTLGIETIWIDGKGREMGAVHLYEQGWKLDWECFAPYSSANWSRFLLGEFEQEGTFRLLVRRRRSGDGAKRMLLSFYRPPEFFEQDGEFKKTESPEVSVPLDSKLGKKFVALWEAREKEEAPYGSILEALDPEGYMRVTAKLAWEKGEFKDKVLTLRSLVGVGWYGSKIQGLRREAMKKEKAAQEGEDES